MPYVDLNCDLGESFGAYTIGRDAEVIPHITSANIACGWHGGDPLVMEQTVRLCARAGIGIGAHPSFPDLRGFGRRVLAVSADEARTDTIYQIGALSAFCAAAGIPLRHVKPHGALYNTMAKDEKLARAVCEGIRAVSDELIVVALAGSPVLSIARELGLKTCSEVFADRGYREDGSLVPRGEPGAMITDTDEAVARVVRMVCSGEVVINTGVTIPLCAESICVHGDGAHALEFVSAICSGLSDAGVSLRPMWQTR